MLELVPPALAKPRTCTSSSAGTQTQRGNSTKPTKNNNMGPESHNLVLPTRARCKFGSRWGNRLGTAVLDQGCLEAKALAKAVLKAEELPRHLEACSTITVPCSHYLPASPACPPAARPSHNSGPHPALQARWRRDTGMAKGMAVATTEIEQQARMGWSSIQRRCRHAPPGPARASPHTAHSPPPFATVGRQAAALPVGRSRSKNTRRVAQTPTKCCPRGGARSAKPQGEAEGRSRRAKQGEAERSSRALKRDGQQQLVDNRRVFVCVRLCVRACVFVCASVRVGGDCLLTTHHQHAQRGKLSYTPFTPRWPRARCGPETRHPLFESVLRCR